MKETQRTKYDFVSDKGDEINEEVCFSGCDRGDKSVIVHKFCRFPLNIGPEVQASVYEKVSRNAG